MGKTFQLHLRIENDTICKLKKDAEERKLSISELCREKLRTNSKLDQIELILQDISKKLKSSNKLNTGGTKW